MADDIPCHRLEVNQSPPLPIPRQGASPDIQPDPRGAVPEMAHFWAKVYTFVEHPNGPNGNPTVSVEESDHHAEDVYPHTVKLMLPPGPATMR